MNDKDWTKMMRFALDEPDSRFAIFMKRVCGYRFFPVDSVVCVPKFILYERYKHYPHELELLEQGIHPGYRRTYKEEFDQLKTEQWISQSPSQPTTDQDY